MRKGSQDRLPQPPNIPAANVSAKKLLWDTQSTRSEVTRLRGHTAFWETSRDATCQTQAPGSGGFGGGLAFWEVGGRSRTGLVPRSRETAERLLWDGHKAAGFVFSFQLVWAK